QAEDGIRDYKVTGVQTCALPIFGAPGFCTNMGSFQRYNASTSVGVGWIADGVYGTGTDIELTRAWSALAAYEHIWNPHWRTAWRSEERRVGKECSAGWARGGREG